MDWSSSSKTTTLTYGDHVTLKYLGGCLSTKGVISDEVMLAKDVNQFENCLWEVYVQNQYSAVEEYEEVLLSYAHGDKEGTTELLNQLRRAANNERKLNQRLMSMKYGKPVSFGDVIQFRHVISKKFLTVNQFVLAKAERENMQVVLDNNGTSMSWFDVLPRSKFDREGQKISNNSETILRCHEKPNEYLHSSKKFIRAIGGSSSHIFDREINCSLESTSWTVSIYQTACNISSNKLLAGNIVTFRDPESLSYLVQDKLGHVIMAPIHPLSFLGKECIVGSHSLWMVESENLLGGGDLKYSNNERIVLRHFNSGNYLKVSDSDILSVVSSREECTPFEFASVLSSQAQQREGSLHIANNSILQICAAIIDSNINAMSPYKYFTTINSRTTTNSPSESKQKHTEKITKRLLSRKVSSLYCNEEEANIVPKLSLLSKECAVTTDINKAVQLTISKDVATVLEADLFFGVENAGYIEKFIELAKERNASQSLSDSQFQAAVKQLFRTLDHIVDFLSESTTAPSSGQQQYQDTFEDRSMNNEANRNKNKKLMIRQTLMKEQRVLDLILDIVEMCGTDMFVDVNINHVRKNMRNKSSLPAFSVNSKRSFRKLVSLSNEEKNNSPSPTPENKERPSNLIAPLSPLPPPSMFNTPGTPSTGRAKIRKKFSNDNIASIGNPSPQTPKGGNKKNFISRALSNSADDDDRSVPSPAATNPHGARIILKPIRDKPESVEILLTHSIASVCLKALLAVIKGHHDNQMYIADRFPILLKQVILSLYYHM